VLPVSSLTASHQKANDADKLDGVDSIAFARLPMFASVDDSGSAFLDRGVDGPNAARTVQVKGTRTPVP
jgi:hypothetical protein